MVELAACLDYLRAGDTLVVPSLDRLSRSLQDLITLLDARAAHHRPRSSPGFLQRAPESRIRAGALSETLALIWCFLVGVAGFEPAASSSRTPPSEVQRC